MSESNLLFDVKDLAVRYPNGEYALHHVNFSVESPSFMAIIGPNGSGKSTLLKAALGLIQPTRGFIKMMGYDSVRDSHKIQRMVRYVPQRDQIGLNIPMKVKDIALMGRLLKKSPPRFASSKDKRIAKEALKQVDMLELWERPFPELSGGQRQRVLVARALAGKGSILILDEPLAGTDAESQRLIVDALEEYHQNNDVSIIMVTHDLNPIHKMVRSVLLLKRTVIGIGAPCSIMDVELLTKVYGPTARIVEYAGHRYCVTHDSGIDRHE
ncbi:MAG: ATP-binding cassette domain-containing protein [Candidatus Lokiarchaeota archaeon]|nr:ATP-binding cassette domain-containing protein [Candidatus Lokiarchaeota archaeon]